MTPVRTILLAVSLLCISLASPVSARTATAADALGAATGAADVSQDKVVRAKAEKTPGASAQAYASREADAKKLERYEGGGTAIYLSSGAAAAVLIIIVLLIVF